MKELGIKPDWARGKIYEEFVKGMTAKEIYETLKNDEFRNQSKNEAIRYIEYFHEQMKA